MSIEIKDINAIAEIVAQEELGVPLGSCSKKVQARYRRQVRRTVELHNELQQEKLKVKVDDFFSKVGKALSGDTNR